MYTQSRVKGEYFWCVGPLTGTGKFYRKKSYTKPIFLRIYTPYTNKNRPYKRDEGQTYGFRRLRRLQLRCCKHWNPFDPNTTSNCKTLTHEYQMFTLGYTVIRMNIIEFVHITTYTCHVMTWTLNLDHTTRQKSTEPVGLTETCPQGTQQTSKDTHPTPYPSSWKYHRVDRTNRFDTELCRSRGRTLWSSTYY